ncbi:MAG TPA: hypothetical protein VFH26_08085 [Gemmatimonadales bacterium]|nr:hypothetical protein [Gemmatimonadales bacterium]
MPGHVFHPGHAELHGVTVVVETKGSRTYVGRYDTEDDRGLHMLDVGVHEEPTDISKDEFISKTAKFGIKTQHRHLVIPHRDVARITRLGELA